MAYQKIKNSLPAKTVELTVLCPFCDMVLVIDRGQIEQEVEHGCSGHFNADEYCYCPSAGATLTVDCSACNNEVVIYDTTQADYGTYKNDK